MELIFQIAPMEFGLRQITDYYKQVIPDGTQLNPEMLLPSCIAATCL